MYSLLAVRVSKYGKYCMRGSLTGKSEHSESQRMVVSTLSTPTLYYEMRALHFYTKCWCTAWDDCW